MRRLLAISGAALLTAGCVTPKVSPPQVTPPRAYEAPKAPTDSLTPASLERWWTLYDDPQLNQLVDQALSTAHDERDARARLEQAAAIRSQTRAQVILPTGNPSATATRTQNYLLQSTSPFGQSGATENLSANFNVSWELDLFGRRGAQLRAADADFYTAAFTYEATRTSLIANVAQSLFQARGLALQLADAQEIARIDHQLEDVARKRFQLGLAAESDLDQAAATAESADAQAENLRAQLVAARRTLLVLIGLGFDPLERLPAAPKVGTPPPVPATLPGDLLRRRPDVRAAEWRLVSASKTLKVDELALLPTIKLNPGVSLTKSTGIFGATTAAWSIGANLTQPVLDRPRLVAQIHAQHAVAEQDVVAYEKAVQTAYSDAENALVYLDSDTRRVDMLRRAEARAQSAYDKSRTAYARGLVDLTTALQAETTWRNIRTQRSSAQATLMQRSVQVFKALGGGWTPETPAAGTAYASMAARGVEGAK
jgi:NodT family efflux transporter outer membrane factor (OMF) lipoprotein